MPTEFQDIIVQVQADSVCASSSHETLLAVGPIQNIIRVIGKYCKTVINLSAIKKNARFNENDILALINFGLWFIPWLQTLKKTLCVPTFLINCKWCQ